MIGHLGRVIERQVNGRIALALLKDRRWMSPVAGNRLLSAAHRWRTVLPPRFRPRNILDVGANIGAVATELCLLYKPEFIGLVEANPDLAKRLASMKFGAHAQVFPCAMGERTGRISFNIVRKGESNNLASSSILPVSSEAKDLWGLRQEKQIEVPLRTLDDVWNECGNGRPLDLLKLDVQGYEPQVLMGAEATLPRIRVIVAEMSFFCEYDGQWLFRRLYEFMNDRGFELSAMYEVARRSNWTPLQCNGVFVNTRMPVNP